MHNERSPIHPRASFLRLCRWAALPVALVCAFAGIAAPAFAQEKNTLESVKAQTLQGGGVVVRFNFHQPLKAIPPSFTVTNPSRIAIDLTNTTNGLGKSTVELGEGDVRSVSIVETSSRARAVLNLTRSLSFTPTLDGNSLVLTIDAVAVASKDNVQVTKFAEAGASAAAPVKQSLRDIDFRRGNNGEGRIIVDLSSPSIGIDIRQQGKNVVVDFLNTTVAREKVRRYDVIDFATPVRTVDVLDQGENTRIVIEPKGLWEYSAYQTESKFVIDVKPVKEDVNKLTQGLGFNGEKLTLNFQSVDVRALLQVIADFTGLNIVMSNSVGGNTTLRLKDVPWDQALEIILQTQGLGKRKAGNVITIAPLDEIATREKLALETSQQITELEPLRTETFELSYAKGSDVKTILSDKDQKILSKRGSVTVDARTNSIFVQDVPARLEDVRRMISQLDVPVRQVLIEARLVVADDSWSRDVGSKLNFGAGLSLGNRNIGVSSNIADAGKIATGTSPVNGTSQPVVDLPAASGGSIGVQILNAANNNLLGLELSALETEGRGKVVSSPRIIAPDKKKATITQGTQIPYATQASSGGVTVAFKDAVLSLTVTPQITPDDKIIMDVEIKKDALGVVFAGVPSIDTKTLQTQVVVDNGDTVVLGGIYEQTVRTDISQIPFFGDLPIVGNLFKRTTKSDSKTELLIFITPRIQKAQLNIH